MNKTSMSTRAMILRCLTDGMGVRPTARATGVSKGTVLRLLEEAGEFASFYHDHVVRGIRAPHQQFDEQWSFVGAHRNRSKNAAYGDVWTFVCLDTESKLVVSYLCGDRSRENTDAIVGDAAMRTYGLTQITTDGFAAYWDAIAKHFTWRRADYAQVIKSYENDDKEEMRRYGPARCTGVEKKKIMGTPDMEKATTSHVENVNLHTRQRCRRFARLTNQHSKTAQNHAHAVALHFFAHNFIRVHATLTTQQGRKMTPAMMHGLAFRPWTVADLVEAMDPTAVTIK
jgi:IS1 family transposase